MNLKIALRLAALIAAVAMVAMACGGASVPGDAEDFILEDASNIVIRNFELMLSEADIPFIYLNDDEDQDDFKDNLTDDWDDSSYSFGNSAHSVFRVVYIFREADFEGHRIIRANLTSTKSETSWMTRTLKRTHTETSNFGKTKMAKAWSSSKPQVPISTEMRTW